MEQYMRPLRIFVGVFVLAGTGLLAARLRDAFFVPPPPVAEVGVERHDNPDGTIDLTVRITNRGGATFRSRKEYWNLNSGLHLEVENAEILEFEARSPLKDYEWYPYHVYPYIRLGNVQFLETRYDRLKYGEAGDARVKIRPTGDGPASLYWRGWLTDAGCMRGLIREIRAGKPQPDYEPCVIRAPATGAPGAEICPIDIATRKHTETGDARFYALKPLSCARVEIL